MVLVFWFLCNWKNEHSILGIFLRALGGLGGGKDLLDPVLALLDVAPLLAPVLLLDLLLHLLGE